MGVAALALLTIVATLGAGEVADGALTLVHNERGSMEWANSTVIASDLLQYSTNAGSNGDIMYQLVDVYAGSAVLLSGIALGNLGGTFHQADIDAGRVSLQQDGSDTTVAGFTFVASHSGSLTGEASWVADVSLAPAPVPGANLRPAVAWASLVTITPELLSYSATGGEPDAIRYYVSLMQAKTSLVLNSTDSITVESGSNTFTQADINAGILQIGHTGTTAEEVGFDFVPVHGNNHGQLSTFTATVLPAAMPEQTAQDEPEAIKWSTGLTIHEELLAYQAGPATDDDLTYTVTSVYNGTLMEINGTQLASTYTGNLTHSETFLQSAVTDRLISLAHDGTITNALGFGYIVRYGDTETEEQHFAVTLEMAPVPSLVANVQGTVSQNTSAVLSWLNLFHLVDGISNSLIEYTVTAILPGTTLSVNGTAVTADGSSGTVGGFTQGDIDAGSVLIGHDGGNDTVAGFDFYVSYGPSSTQPDSFRANVTVNTPTQVNNLKIGVFWKGISTISSQQLTFVVPGASAGEVDYTVSLLWDGTVVKRGNVEILAEVSGRNRFTQQDIDQGLVSISHDGTAGVGEIGFSFIVEGPAGTQSQPSTFAAAVGVSVPEVVANVQTDMVWKGNHRPSQEVLEFEAEGAMPGDIIYTITHMFEGTIFRLNGLTRAPLSRITFTQEDINSQAVALVHDGTFTDLIGFNFTAAYGDAVSPVGMYLLAVATAPAPANVSNVQLSLPWKGSSTIGPSSLSYESSEPEATPSDILYTVRMLLGGSILRRNGLPIGPGFQFYSFTQEDIDLQIMTLAHDGHDLSGEAGFQFEISYGNSVPQAANFTALVGPPSGPTVLTKDPEAVYWGHFGQLSTENLRFTSEGAEPEDILYHVSGLLAGSSVVVGGVPILPMALGSSPAVTNHSFTQLDLNQGLVELHHMDSIDVPLIGFLFTVSYVGHSSPEMAFEAQLLAAPVPVRVKNLGLPEPLPWGGEAVLSPPVLQFTLTGYGSNDIVYSVVATQPSTAVVLIGTQGTVEFTQADLSAGLVSLRHDGTLPLLDNTIGFTFSVRLAGGNTRSEPEDFDATVGQAPAPVEVSNARQGLEWKGQLVLSRERLEYGLLGASQQDQLPVLVLYTVNDIMRGSGLSLDGSMLSAAGPGNSRSSSNSTFTQADVNRGAVVMYHTPGTGPAVDTVGFAFAVTYGNSEPAPEATFTADLSSAPAPEAFALASAAELRVPAGGQVQLSASELGFSAAGAEPSEIVYRLVEVYPDTSLHLAGETAELSPGSKFSQADVNQGLLYVSHTGETPGDLLGFLFVVRYGSTESSIEKLEAQAAGEDEDGPQPPVAKANRQGTVGWRGALLISRDVLEYGPAVGSGLPGGIEFQVVSVMEGGELEMDGSALGPGASFTQASINAGLLLLRHDGSSVGTVGFSFRAAHNGAATTSEQSFSAEIVGPVPAGQQALAIVARMTLLDLTLEGFSDALRTELVGDIALAAGVPDSQVVITSVESGSVVVTTEIAFPTGASGQQLANAFRSAVSADMSGVLDANNFGTVTVEIADETKVTTFGESADDGNNSSSAHGHDRSLVRLCLLAAAAVMATAPWTAVP